MNNPGTTTGSVEYLITAIGPGGSACNGDVTSLVVTVDPEPVLTASAPTICSEDFTNIDLDALTNVVGSSYSWTVGVIVGGITGATADTDPQFLDQQLTNPNPTIGSVEYLITPIGPGGSACNGAIASLIVTVDPKPILTASAPIICSEDFTGIDLDAITDVVGSSYSWTVGTIVGAISGASAGSDAQFLNQQLTNANPTTGSVEYLIIPTGPGGSACAGNTVSLTVTVDPKPILTASTPTICSEDMTGIDLDALTDVVGSSYTWTVGTIVGGITGSAPGGDVQFLNQTLTNPNPTTGSVEYLITPIGPGGSACNGNIVSLVVTVDPKPILTVSAPTICSEDFTNIDLDALTDVAGSSYTWTVGTIVGAIAGSSAGGSPSMLDQQLTNQGITPGSVEYLITATGPGGSACAGNVTSLIVTVDPKPILTASTPTICSEDMTGINLDAITDVIGSSYTWVVGTITGGITGASAGADPQFLDQTLTNPNSTSGSVEYIITPIGPGGSACNGNATSLTVTVDPKPIITASAPIICSDDFTNIDLDALTDVVGSSYSWTVGVIVGGITGASADVDPQFLDQQLNNPGATTGSVEYLITAIGPGGSACNSNVTSLIVTVDPEPVLTASTPTICSEQFTGIDLDALTNVVGSSYSWTVGAIVGGITGASADTDAQFLNQQLTNPNPTTGSVEYLITPIGPGGSACNGAVVSLIVTVDPKPILTASAPTICSDDFTNIDLDAITDVVGSTYSWTLGTIVGGITGAIANTDPQFLNQQLNNPGTTTGSVEYLITAIGPGGSACNGDVTSLIITVDPEPVLTASTPTICSEDFTNIDLDALTNVVGSSYSWTVGVIVGGITGATADTDPQFLDQQLTNPNPTIGSVEYLITPIGPGGSACNGAVASLIVTVDPKPILTASAPIICSEDFTGIDLDAITDVVGSSYSWVVGTITGGITGAAAGADPQFLDQMLTNPNNTSGTVEYVITPTGPGGSACMGNVVSLTVTVDPKPILTASAPIICSGDFTGIDLDALTDVVGSSYSWTLGTIVGGITGASANADPQFLNQQLTNPGATLGSVEYLITAIGPGGSACNSNVTSLIVSVDPIPTLTPSAPTICSEDFTNIDLDALTDVIGSTYSWTVGTVTGGIIGAFADNDPQFLNQQLINPNTTTGTVEYLISPLGPGGASCVATPVSLVVTVDPKPILTTSTPTICDDEFTGINLDAFTSVIGSSYTWTLGTIVGGITGASPGGDPQFLDQQLNNPGMTPGSVEYLVTPIGPGASACMGNTMSIVVTVEPEPIVVATPMVETICDDEVTNIMLNTSITPTAGVVTFSYSATATGGPGAVSGFTTAASGLVDGAMITDMISNNTDVVQTVTYAISPVATAAKGGAGCTGPIIMVVVTVEPEPTVTATPVAQTICDDETTAVTLNTVTVPTAGAVTFNYMAAATGAPGDVTGFTASAMGLVDGAVIADMISNNTDIVQTVTYTITPAATAAKGGAGCTGPSIMVDITVEPAPTVVATPATETICDDERTNVTLTTPTMPTLGTVTFDLTATATGGPGGVTGFSTSLNGLPDGFVIADAISNNTSSFQRVTYLVTPRATGAKAGLGCVGASIMIEVFVEPEPTVSATPMAETICDDGTTNITLNASSVPTGSVTFNFAATATGLPGDVSGFTTSAMGLTNGAVISDMISNNTVDPQTVTYTITPVALLAKGGLGCTGPDITVDVLINPTPDVIFTPAMPPPICSGDLTSIDLTSSVAGTTFSWTVTESTSMGASPGGGSSSIQQTSINTTAVAQTAIYHVTPDAAGCPGPTMDVTVTVNPTPTASISGNATICNGEASTITFTLANSVTGTYDVVYNDGIGNFNLDGISPGHTINVSPSATTSYTLVSVTDNSAAPPVCTGTVDVTPATIIVNPLPVAIMSGGSTICNDGSTSNLFVIATAGTGPFTVQIDDGGAGFTVNNYTSGDPIVVTPTTTTNYSIASIADNNTCSVSSPSANLSGSAIVIVNDLPTVTILSSDVVICDDSPASMADITVQFTGAGPWTLEYNDETSNTVIPNIITSLHTLQVPGIVGETTTYSLVSVNDSNNPICSNTSTESVDITRNALPTAEIEGTTNICASDETILSFNLSGVGPFDVIYNNGASNFDLVAISDGHTVTVTPTFTTTYTLISAEDSNNPMCGPMSLGSPAIVTVNPLPIANIIPSAISGCAPLIGNFRNQTPGAGTEIWLYREKGTELIIQDGGGAFASFTFDNKGDTTKVYEVIYQVTDLNNCFNSDTIDMTVFPEVVPVFSVAGESQGCTPHFITFSNDAISNSSSVIYIWNWGDGSTNDTTTTESTIDHTFQNFSTVAVSNFNVILTARDFVSGCTDQSSQVVSIFPFVQTNVQADVQQGCAPLNVNFTNLTLGSTIHEWFARVKGTENRQQQQSTFFAAFQLPNNGTETLIYEVVYIGTNGFGCSEEIITEVTVFPEVNPSFTADPLRSQINETDGVITIENTTPNKSSWDHTWDWGDGSTSNDVDPGSHQYESFGQYQILLTVTNGNCTEEASVLIEIDPVLPQVDFTFTPVNGCAPLTVEFTNLSQYTDPSLYLWDFGDRRGQSRAENPVYTYTEPGSYIVTLEGSNEIGFLDKKIADVFIDVYENARANFTLRPSVAFLQGDGQGGFVSDPVAFANFSFDAFAYQWDFGDGTSSTDIEPSHQYTNLGLYDVTLIAENEEGCNDTLYIADAVLVESGGGIAIPTVFTPNPSGPGGGRVSGGGSGAGNENNDVFLPRFVGAVNFRMEIFSRWGELVYQTNDQSRGWDGYVNGKLAPQGVYLYKLTIEFIDGQRITRIGDVAIIR